jgi:hypothetical protein
MFITSRNFSQLRELISLADAERNNPAVVLGNAVAEGPVYLCHFDQVEDDIIRPSAT